MKIAVYAISKNEAKFAKRCIDSVRDEADEVIVADTGSTDGTQQILRSCGATVYNIHINPWRFDVARNTSLSLVPADADVCVRIDLDEILEKGWSRHLKAKWTQDTTRCWYWYYWSPENSYMDDRIHARFGYIWKYICHETLFPTEETREIYANIPEIVLRHFPDKNKSRSGYLRLLEKAAKESNDPKIIYYWGRENFYQKKYDAAAEILKKIIESNQLWIMDKVAAMRQLADTYKAIGKDGDRFAWLLRACAEQPDSRENWLWLAEYCYEKNDFVGCYGHALKALQVTTPPKHYQKEPIAWGERPFDLASVAAWNIGLKQESIEYAKKAVQINPHDPRLKSNLEIIKKLTRHGEKNLIYFTLGCNVQYVRMLDLSLQSLHKLGNYGGDILVIAPPEYFDAVRSLPSIRPFTLHLMDSEEQDNLLTSSANKLKIYKFGKLNEYDNILFLDTDVLVAGDIARVFKNAKDGIVSASLDLARQPMTSEYFNCGLMTPDECADIQQNNILGINAGVFVFKPSAAKLLEEAHKLVCEAKSHSSCLEQPFLNYVLYKTKKYSTSLDDVVKHVGPGSLEPPGSATIIHFPGFAGKFDWKIKAMESRLSEFIAVKTSR